MKSKDYLSNQTNQNTPEVVQIPFTNEVKLRVHVIPQRCQCHPIKSKILNVLSVMSFVGMCHILLFRLPETAEGAEKVNS